MARNIVLFLVFTFILSCGNSEKKGEAIQEKPTEFKTKMQFKPFVRITPEVEKEVEKWEAYRSLNRFMDRFTNATPEEILSNALELRDLVKSAKFSKNIPKIFDVPPVRARFNILYNQTLRLSDMTFIPAITADAVIAENEKILLSYSSINSRFISILSKKRFEDEIEIDINAIGLDSTKIDSISKKTISRNLENRQLEKVLQNRKNKKGKN
ncbi:MAG: hypothetical protein ACON4X_09300 [Polaribacter sp.]